MTISRTSLLWRWVLLVAWLWGIAACAAEVGLGHVMLSEEQAKHPVLGNMNEILRSLRSLRMTGIGPWTGYSNAASFCPYECRPAAWSFSG